MRTGQFRGRDHTKQVAPKHCRDARFVWIDKVPTELIAGEIKKFVEAAGVESVRLPAYAFGQWGSGSDAEIPLARDGEKIVMHLHGGAYVMGTAHPEDITSYIPRGFVQFGQNMFKRCISIDYRLSASHPYSATAPFPASLLDGLAGYLYLTRKLGFKPQNVIISGDSAGGNLGQALVRYLRDNPQLGIGMPGGLILFSPWSDPGGSHEGLVGGEAAQNANYDYVQLKANSNPKLSMQLYAVRSLLGKISVQDGQKNPYISPASLKMDPKVVRDMFVGFPPSYVVGGGAETLIDQIRTLKQRMEANIPGFVYNEVADGIHDFACLPFWEPERSNTFNSIVDWVDKL